MTLFTQKLHGASLSFVIAYNDTNDRVTLDIESNDLTVTLELDRQDALYLGNELCELALRLTPQESDNA